MGLLRKHWDALLLAVALIGLTIFTISLAQRIDDLSARVGDAPLRLPGGTQLSASPDLGSYSNALGVLQNPTQWTTPLPRRPADKIEPPPPEPLPFTARVVSVPFDLTFRAYSGAGRSFQLDSRSLRRSFLISEVGDPVRDGNVDTGCRIAGFQHKAAQGIDPRFGGERVMDLSQLTLVRAAGPPVVLVLERQALDPEPTLWVRCTDDRDKAGEFRVRLGERFACAGASYRMVRFTPTQVIVTDEQSGKELIVPSDRKGE